jgi:hypothetical protein
MGRGRAKAKQTKVARDLKYRSYSTDFASLERELRGGDGEPIVEELDEDAEDPDEEDDDDPYADLASRYSDPGDSDVQYRRIG